MSTEIGGGLHGQPWTTLNLVQIAALDELAMASPAMERLAPGERPPPGCTVAAAARFYDVETVRSVPELRRRGGKAMDNAMALDFHLFQRAQSRAVTVWDPHRPRARLNPDMPVPFDLAHASVGVVRAHLSLKRWLWDGHPSLTAPFAELWTAFDRDAPAEMIDLYVNCRAGEAMCIAFPAEPAILIQAFGGLSSVDSPAPPSPDAAIDPADAVEDHGCPPLVRSPSPVNNWLTHHQTAEAGK